MSFDPDDEILQDFLVEAGELLEALNEQLVELEQSPRDKDLLNAVFRSFHTIKGGASFLGLDALVEVCHRAEDVFNSLRQGEREVDAALMDVVLEVLDVVNAMFEGLRDGQEPQPAEARLLQALEGYVGPAETEAPEAVTETPGEGTPDPGAADAPAQVEPDPEPAASTSEGSGAGTAVTDGESASGAEEITDEEFEALLDQLQGAAPNSATGARDRPEASPAADAKDAADTGAGDAGGDDLITEEEFEALLDQLQGAGTAAGSAAGDAPSAAADTPPEAAPTAEAAASAPATKAPDPAAKASTGDGGGVEQGRRPDRSAKGKTGAKDKPAAGAKGHGHGSASEATVRVDTRQLDEIMNLVGELVLVRNRLATLRTTLGDEDVAKAVGNLDLVTSDLQASVMKTRMQPIKKVFGRFPRVVRDLARNLKKEVKLELEGEDTDLDKNLVEALADPLIHLVRNAVDHGIEMPAEREAKGKPRAGQVRLIAEQEGDHILLTIQDDGKGMNPDVLRAKAVEKGILDADSAARLDDREAFSLIFAPGFSTKEQISDVSGRGVGMDVVKHTINQLNGSVDIDSREGVGTRIVIRLPLTLAIMPTLMVMLGGQPFALPLASVNEIFDLDTDQTNVVDGQRVVVVRGRAVPLFFLRDWLVRRSITSVAANDGEQQGPGHVVMVNAGSRTVGFVVDQLVGQEEVVIKPLGAMLHGMPGFAGATITGDGRIALILDVPSLMKRYARVY